MSECGKPSVYVVDSHVTRPPLPPRVDQRLKHTSPAQILLFMLVGLALFGMLLEACFIYHLYHRDSDSTSASSAMMQQDASPSKESVYEIPPSKPVAHLTDGQDVVHRHNIMSWSMNAEPLLYGMTYSDGKLIINTQGYYYVYSKVFFSDHTAFHHAVSMKTEKYAGGNITLLQSRKYTPLSNNVMRSNSYLGGVFHLYKNDAIFVSVSNTKHIERHKPYENVFGAYMI
ncbi:tumor necrosis factor ligand superfamily member 14 [Mugil cephalus]|uniref:tumor necrosis factor ligand superfamily member 14 n=1 Tax=Mugil cephalus TaxID=48193 RepID=UPI001FB74571|nr:tumor necrosis factor ligand superfamily member 14 [Mugil cephalus]